MVPLDPGRLCLEVEAVVCLDRLAQTALETRREFVLTRRFFLALAARQYIERHTKRQAEYSG